MGIRRHSHDGTPRGQVLGPALALAFLVLAAGALTFWASVKASAWTRGPASAPFPYTGVLSYNGAGIDGRCEFVFALHDSKFGGRQIGGYEERTLEVVRGSFATALDFGVPIDQAKKGYLSASVRCPWLGDGYFEMVRELVGRPGRFDIRDYQALVQKSLDSEGPSGPGLALTSDPGEPTTPAPVEPSGHKHEKRETILAAMARPSEYPGERRESGSKGGVTVQTGKFTQQSGRTKRWPRAETLGTSPVILPTEPLFLSNAEDYLFVFVQSRPPALELGRPIDGLSNAEDVLYIWTALPLVVSTVTASNSGYIEYSKMVDYFEFPGGAALAPADLLATSSH